MKRRRWITCGGPYISYKQAEIKWNSLRSKRSKSKTPAKVVYISKRKAWFVKTLGPLTQNPPNKHVELVIRKAKAEFNRQIIIAGRKLARKIARKYRLRRKKR